MALEENIPESLPSLVCSSATGDDSSGESKGMPGVAESIQ